MGIIYKNISVETYHFVGIVKHYYRLLRQIYSIITIKIPGIELNLAF